MPSVTRVRRWEDEGSRPLTLTGLQRPDRIYHFAYESGTAGASLLFTQDYEGEVEFSQHLLRVGQPAPQEQIEAVRPLMLQVEAALAEQCGIEQLSERVEEQ